MRLTIYSKPDCHLCDDMKSIVRRAVAGRRDIQIEEVDISGNEDLLNLYGLEIPVLLIDGTKSAKYRISEGALRRMLEARPGGAD